MSPTKKELHRKSFFAIFATFFQMPFLQNTSRQLPVSFTSIFCINTAGCTLTNFKIGFMIKDLSVPCCHNMVAVWTYPFNTWCPLKYLYDALLRCFDINHWKTKACPRLPQLTKTECFVTIVKGLQVKFK